MNMRNHTMYKVIKAGKTLFLGRLGDCWIYMRDEAGHAPASELQAAGWKIEPARDGAMKRALAGIA